MQNHIEHAYHYTSCFRLDDILLASSLWANTDPYSCSLEAAKKAKNEASGRVKDIVRHDLYLVCLLEPEDSGWTESGLLKSLLSHTTRDVLIKVPVIERDGAFLRDAIPLANYFVKPRAGEDYELFRDKMDYYCHLKDLSYPELVGKRFYRDYIESTTRLENYDGSFRAPELWLPQNTPLKKLDIFKLKRGLFSRRGGSYHRSS